MLKYNKKVTASTTKKNREAPQSTGLVHMYQEYYRWQDFNDVAVSCVVNFLQKCIFKKIPKYEWPKVFLV